jgi:hypothetical protein
MSIISNSYPGGLKVKTTLLENELSYTMQTYDYYLIVKGSGNTNIYLSPTTLGQEFSIRNASSGIAYLIGSGCKINEKDSYKLKNNESILIVYDNYDYEVMTKDEDYDPVNINGDIMNGTLRLPSLGASGSNALNLISNLNCSENSINGVTNFYANNVYQNNNLVASTSSSPISISSGNISITKSNSTTNGYLSSTDFNTFNEVTNKVSKSGDTITGTLLINKIIGDNSFSITGSGSNPDINITSNADGVNGGTIKIQAIEGSLNASTILLLADSPNINVGGMIYTNANIVPSGNDISIGTITKQWNSIYSNNIYQSGNQVISSINSLSGPNVSINTSNVPEGTKLYFTTARAKAVISGTTPISTLDGLITIQQSNSTQSGYLTSTDWNIFNNKTKEKCNEIPYGTINGINNSFTLQNIPNFNSVKLFKNGLYMIPNSASGSSYDYSISGSTIIYLNAPSSGSNHICNYNY